METFREVGSTMARKIGRMTRSMSGLESLDDLERRFMQESNRILPGDCMCWNNWATDLSHLLTYRTNEGYMQPLGKLVETLNQVVAHHPVIAAGQLAATAKQVMRLSDFQSVSKFRNNPLFHEVYRHLDSHYQICYTASALEDRLIVLTWNRRALDFTERDRQVFHLMGLQLGLLSRKIEQRQRLDLDWRALCAFVDSKLSIEPVSSLGTQDLRVLTELMRGRSRQAISQGFGVRRDSIDKHLGAIRERLGLENHHQLLSALAQLRSPHGN